MDKKNLKIAYMVAPVSKIEEILKNGIKEGAILYKEGIVDNHFKGTAPREVPMLIRDVVARNTPGCEDKYSVFLVDVDGCQEDIEYHYVDCSIQWLTFKTKTPFSSGYEGNVTFIGVFPNMLSKSMKVEGMSEFDRLDNLATLGYGQDELDEMVNDEEMSQEEIEDYQIDMLEELRLNACACGHMYKFLS